MVSQRRDKDNIPFGPLRIFSSGGINPGLAVSRSLGDAFAHSLGCSSIPDINHHKLTKSDQVIIIGTDGIYEHLSNTQIANIVYPYYEKNKDALGAAKRVVKQA